MKRISVMLLGCVLLAISIQAQTPQTSGGDFERAVIQSIDRQMHTYPKSTLKDLYKSFFQDKFGPGHIIADRAAAERYLQSELSSYTEASGEVAEPTGWQHNFRRLNLSVLKNELIPYDLFLDAFVRSVNGVKPISIEAWKKEWQAIEAIIRSLNLALPDYDTDLAAITQKLTEGNYVGHHSDPYTEAYQPHYRIVSRQIYEEELLPLLKK